MATTIILGLFILICFGASVITCNEAIENVPFCKESLKELKDDVKDWQKICKDDQLYDIDTPCCNAEKEYIKNRRRIQRKLCFFKGNHLTIFMLTKVYHCAKL